MSPAAAIYTAEQETAIGRRDVSIALSAGAGCGKTFVLTERFLAHFDPRDPDALQPADLSELVAITFTDRAAREMRDRIRLKCFERLQSSAGDDAAYWLSLLRALDRARVSTIHGFCASLLRTYAVEAAVDPLFGVLEQSHAQTLRYELIDDHIRRRMVDRDPDVMDLIELVGLERLRTFVLTLLDTDGLMDDDRWVNTTPAEQLDLWSEFHQQEVVPRILTRVARSPEAAKVIEILTTTEVAHPVFVERRALLLDLLPRLEKSAAPDRDFSDLREAAKVQGAGGKKVWNDDEAYDAYRQAATALRTLIDNQRALTTFDRDGALPAAEVGLKLFRFSRAVGEAYQQSKRTLGLLDFDDLMVRARRLLVAGDPAVRGRIASQIRLLLVDEFQDTDPLQVELVKALCGEGVSSGRLFFVGDFKQSIYRFRGADPRVFRALEADTPAEGRLPLTLNFRSQPAILDFVNALFADCFQDYQPLRSARGQVAPTPAVEMMWVPNDGSVREAGTTDRLRQEEANWIARRIRGMLDRREPRVWDREAASRAEPKARAAEPGDFAILFHALTDVQHYEEALRRYGIDYYLVGGHAFYAQQEVFDLMNLLRTLSSTLDGVSLAGVLRSPFFSLSDETLYWLAQHEAGLAGGLFAPEPPATLDAESRARVMAAARTIRELRAMKDRVPIATLINEALKKTGYDAALLGDFLGERKLANLRKLIDDARGFDRSGTFTLADFLVQLSQFVAEQPREPLAATHPESTNVVRLMTIHQAKGLEFPIVFVPDVDRRSRGASHAVHFDAQLGPLVRHDSNLPRCGYDFWKVLNDEEDREERKRLLYVACTRAADYLVLSGAVTNLENPSGSWTSFLAERFDLQSGQLACTLPDGFNQPEIKVTQSAPESDRKPAGKTHSKDLAKLVEQAAAFSRQGKGSVPELIHPIPVDRGGRRQFSFSRLDGAIQTAHAPQPVDADAVAPSAADAFDPRELGSLVHAILEVVPFDRTADAAAIARQLAWRQFDQPGSEVETAVQLVTQFLTSDRAAQLSAAREVHRELEFLLAWPPDSPTSEGRRLQGIIDCLYQDAEGTWQVLDYKTNRVAQGKLDEVAATYEMQLYVYLMAAEQVLGTAPRQGTLHFLRTGLEKTYCWDDSARRRVTEFVNRRIAELVQ